MTTAQFIIHNHKEMTSKEIAAALGKNIIYIRSLLRKLNLKAKNYNRRDQLAESDAIIFEHLGKIPNTEISKLLGKRSTYVQSRLQLLKPKQSIHKTPEPPQPESKIFNVGNINWLTGFKTA